MLSDVFILLMAAYLILLGLAFYFEEPLIALIAGVVGLLMGFQAFSETSSAAVGISMTSIGLITLVGGLGDIVSREK